MTEAERKERKREQSYLAGVRRRAKLREQFPLQAKKCVICGAEFTSGYKHKATCSRPCSIEHKRRENRRWGHKVKADAKCNHCGKAFSKLANSQRVYCSDECRKAAMDSQTVIGVCWQCGVEFGANGSHSRRYCSAQCREDYKALARQERQLQAATSAPLQVDTTWAAIRPAIACQDYDYPVHTNHAAFCPFPGVAA